MRVESTRGAGASFVHRMARPREAGRGARPARRHNDARALVVDDKRAARRALAQMLGRWASRCARPIRPPRRSGDGGIPRPGRSRSWRGACGLPTASEAARAARAQSRPAHRAHGGRRARRAGPDDTAVDAFLAKPATQSSLCDLVVELFAPRRRRSARTPPRSSGVPRRGAPPPRRGQRDQPADRARAARGRGASVSRSRTTAARPWRCSPPLPRASTRC
jgi:hypothetical protein